ncbi:MAG TPA: glycine cleavage system protein GcvH [Chloroflexota bacterium]|nr:glycine cleavage system protein GcvH [Chloroflexota bacterium]
MNPDDLLYTSSHEWLAQGSPATIGITQFAQDQLGDVVFVELPEVGATITLGETFGSVESVKTVSDLYAPVTGTVAEVNSRLVDAPELINTSPFDEGWLIRVDITDDAGLADLMDRATYDSTVAH